MGIAEDLVAAARKRAEEQLKAATGQSGSGAQLAGGLLNTLGIGGKKPETGDAAARPTVDVPSKPAGVAPSVPPTTAAGIANAITGAAGKLKDRVVEGAQAVGTAAAGLAITAAAAALPEGTYLEDGGKGKPPVVVNVDRLQAEAEERIRIEREQAAGIYREGTGVGSNFVTVDTTAPIRPATAPAITATVSPATPGGNTFVLVTPEEHRTDLAAQATTVAPASTVSASASGIVAATPVATAFTEAAATATAAAKPSVTPGLDQSIQETQAVDPERAALLKRARDHVAKLGAPAP